MFAQSFPGAVEVTCFFFLPQLFLSPLLRLTHFAAFKGGNEGGFHSHGDVEGRGLKLCVCGENTAIQFGRFNQPPCGVLGKIATRVCHTSTRCPALSVLTTSSWPLNIVTAGRLRS